MITKTARQDAVLRVASTFVHTPDCNEATKSFDLLMALGALAGGLCLLICGESGVGKSTLVKWLIRNLKSNRNKDGVSRPAIYIEIPTAPTAIGVFETMLEALGDPKPSQGTRTVKKRRVIKMLREQNVKLLVLDDLQHIVDRQSDRILFDASEAIKEILIEYPISTLCAGLADAERVVLSNEQLSRRHMATQRLERFNWKVAKSRRAFVGVLLAFQQSMEIYELPDLKDESVALRFYLATGGIMDFVFKLFLFSAQIAAENNLDGVRLATFQEAWERAFLHSNGGENSFQPNFDLERDKDAKIERAMKINLPPLSTRLRAKGAKGRLQRAGL